MSFTAVYSSIMGRSSTGLLIDLHLHDFFPADQAVMYYNYIAIFLIVIWAAFASQSTESRYAFSTPLMAAMMVWFGWLNAGGDATHYWGMILLCLLLGALIYINDMNHEKFGLPGPGDKLVGIAVMIMCFTACFGFIASSEFGMFDDNQQSGASQNVMCNRGYTCDASGNIDMSVSVTSVNSSGGLGLDVWSLIALLPTIALTMLKLFVIIVGSILFFGIVVLAAYPALSDSGQVVAFLAVLNVVFWLIYALAFFRLIYKPMGTGGDI